MNTTISRKSIVQIAIAALCNALDKAKTDEQLLEVLDQLAHTMATAEDTRASGMLMIADRSKGIVQCVSQDLPVLAKPTQQGNGKWYWPLLRDEGGHQTYMNVDLNSRLCKLPIQVWPWKTRSEAYMALAEAASK